MLIIFLGPPGSGKGTQGRVISSHLNLKHVSTGEMLRAEVKSFSDLGRKIGDIMERGELVTDDLVNEIVATSLMKSEYKSGCILDGYPRTIEQAVYLESKLTEDYLVFYFNIDSEKLKGRVSKRFVCKDCGEIYNELVPLKVDGECNKCHSTIFEHRTDDNEIALIKRLEVYKDQIAMILDFYAKRGRLNIINADDSVENVTNHILEAVKKH